jgi:glycosyltransferase involved in cell wall biosynthesis
MPKVDILLPTCNRLESLIMTLTGVASQDFTGLHLVLSDQSDAPVLQSPVVRSLLRMIEARGGTLETHYRQPSKGIAEQRDFLLGRASSEALLYLDDDVWMEPWVLSKLYQILKEEGCGFVGAFPNGLSYREDVRPAQQQIEYWEGPVQPEVVEPGQPAWERWQLHRAANLYHVSQSLPPGEVRRYKVAWIAACILYDRQKLQEIGGFSFWPRLPRFHSGEEVLVQNLLMRRWGGCAIIPSGTYFSELPSTVLNPEGTVDGHALDLLPEMAARYAVSETG